jgi:hypothetical protein
MKRTLLEDMKDLGAPHMLSIQHLLVNPSYNLIILITSVSDFFRKVKNKRGSESNGHIDLALPL